MDEPEADYLRRQIQELRQAKGRWQALALISLSVLALLILAGGATLLTGGLLLGQRMQAEWAQEAEREVRIRAEEAAHQAKETGKAAEPGNR